MAEHSRRGIEPPDLSEKGGLKGGAPQRSDDRLFIQLLAFGACSSAVAVKRELDSLPMETVVYEDLNDPQGIAVLALSRDPNAFVDCLRPVLNHGIFGSLTHKPEFTMFGRTYSLCP